MEASGSFSSPADNLDRLNVHPDSIIADLGAGSGHYVFDLAERIRAQGGKGVVYAVDVQRSLLDRIKTEAHRKNLGSIHILWADIEVPRGIKLADNICDIVLVSNVLFQSEDKVAFLKEATRIMKPNGVMMIIDWNLHISKDEVVREAIAAGLVVKSEFNAGSHHFGVILNKR